MYSTFFNVNSSISREAKVPPICALRRSLSFPGEAKRNSSTLAVRNGYYLSRIEGQEKAGALRS